MKLLAYFRSLGARFLRRARADKEMEEEGQLHIQLRATDLERCGMARSEAERQARIEFGSQEQFKTECREAMGGNFLDTLIQDVRFGFRILTKSRGLTAVIVLTIAIGVGATTAIFSVVDATLLHSLPFPNAGQLLQVVEDLPGLGAKDVGISIPEWKDFESSGIFEYVALIGGGDVNLTGASQPVRVVFANVPPNYFALLGVNPQLGRAFGPQDKTPGFTGEAVISDRLWKESFGGDSQVVGKNLRLDNDLYHVIGVMPPGFRDPLRTVQQRNTQIWLASGFSAPPAPPPVRNSRFIPEAIARLKPGMTIATAQSRIDALVAALRKQFPDDYPAEAGWSVRLVPLKKSIMGNVSESLILLFGAVGLVLLIGCVNVANLLLARASTRGREMAIRRALGGSRNRLVRQLATESLLLSLIGGTAGLAILFATKGLLLRVIPESLPELNPVSISWRVLAFALLVSVISGLIFGVAPAWQAGRSDAVDALKSEGRTSNGSKGQARTRRLLVISEFAFALVLMIVAGLLLRSFWDLLNVSPGFNPDKAMVVRTWLPVPNDPSTDIYGSPDMEAPLLREILRRVKTLPAIEEAAVGNIAAIPLGHNRNNLNFYPLVCESQEVPKDRAPLVNSAVVTPEYFRLLQIPLQRGRSFSEADKEKTPAVVMINEAMARTYWPNANPIGDRIKVPVAGNPSSIVWNTIIGVVGNARTESLADSGTPQFYLCAYQRRPRDLAIFVRGRFNPASIPIAVREQVQSINRELPVFGAQTLDQALSQSLSERRFSMEIAGLFGMTALVLAGIGIYGVTAYMVSERKHEIGVRIALGAEKTNIFGMVLRQGLRMALSGAAMGIAGGLLVSRLMTHLLYKVRPTDPVTFGAVTLLFIGVAVVACYLPALRATKVDPMIALRDS